MAKRRTRQSFRITSPAIYRESQRGLVPDEQRANLANEAFGASLSLRSPSPAQRRQLSGGRAFPTTARYWTDHSPQRLKSPTPLKGESRARAKARAAKARSYFAAEARREKLRTKKQQWRVVITGSVEQSTPTGSRVMVTSGTQAGPWRDVPPGGLTDQAIQQAYREVARYSVAINAKGKPEFGALRSKNFEEYRRKGDSSSAILYVDAADVETREVGLDDDAESAAL